MDLRCPRCSEPWDFDSLHDAYDEANDRVIPYAEALREFKRIGCGAFDGAKEPTCVKVNNTRTLATETIYDLLGDDIDGAAALLDDFEFLGMLDG